ncbi:MAG: response regulator [Phototrophicaceae bacterium]|jgi:CheY-like chemotaxis protein
MLRILYVEDNPANLSLVHRVAKLGGHEVVNRSSGETALRDFSGIKPDLVLMDIQLEGKMSGLDVVRVLRQQGYNVPIVAVTAYAMKGDKEKALEAGCDEYLPKPLPIQELVALIERYQKLVEQKKTGEVPSVLNRKDDNRPNPVDFAATVPVPESVGKPVPPPQQPPAAQVLPKPTETPPPTEANPSTVSVAASSQVPPQVAPTPKN